MSKTVNFGEFLKTWNFRSNSVTRLVENAKIEKFKRDILRGFSNTVHLVSAWLALHFETFWVKEEVKKRTFEEFVKAAADVVFLSLPFQAIFLAPSAVMHCEHERGRTAGRSSGKWPTSIPAFSYVIAQKKEETSQVEVVQIKAILWFGDFSISDQWIDGKAELSFDASHVF